MAEWPTDEEEEARHYALGGGCQLIVGGGHCDDITSVVLGGGGEVGFNDWSEAGGKWDEKGKAELMLPKRDRERIRLLLVEAGRKLREIEAIGESWRERLTAEASREGDDRDLYRHRDDA